MRRFGRYTLVKKLATGGMAEIWLARQRGLAGFNRFVVIKKILSHLSEQETFVKMFLDEARTSAQLNHPNVVQIYDLGKEVDSYFIAMEFIAGENLAAIAWRGMKRGKPFPPAFAARVIADACKALHYAHHLKGSDGQALEIVHRDISPQNILVTYEGEVKVVDFGIAKAATKSETTKTGMLKGKFSYMSPEQCLGAHVDMRSDIFALGILLYELCTGKRLFKHESELMILEMITKRSVVPPSQVAPGISSGLEDIIMRALEKDVSARFATAQQMQIALEEYLRDEGHQAANADVASYMRELFSDKIEEKRRLREIASRDDFEASFGDEEATEQAMGGRGLGGATGNRRVVQGMSPSAMRPMTATGQQPYPGATGTGSIPPGMASHPGMMPPGMTPPGYHPGATPSQANMMQYSGQYPYPPGTYSQVPPDQGGGWVARVVIAGALIVILVASFILYQQLTPQTQQMMPAPPPIPRGPQQTGSLTLESVPVGATIYLDGKPMRLPNGENAKTPSDLHSLQYGVTYRIRLSKEGYKPYEETIEMGEATDSKTVRPELEAFPGKLIANVTGDDRTNVRVLFNGKDMGLGPRVEKQLPGHEDVLVSAELPRHTCTASPVRVTVKPNETVETTIRCRKRTARRAPPPPPPSGGTTRRAPPPPPAASGGCVTNANLSPGYATINTTPYAEVYWGKRKLGQTPIARVQLPAGCIKIRAVSLDGSKTRTVQIKVEPNEVAIYQFKLDG